MDDEKIVELYFDRNEQAISETENKYGKYCFSVAFNILSSNEDSKECVNDTWVNAWNSIPPQRPGILKAFLGKIARNIALNRLDFNMAKKRGSNICDICDELNECIPDGSPALDDEYALKEAINGFLSGLDKRIRVIFMRRYWYACPVKEIAQSMNMSENNVSVILHRTRNQFREYLHRKGIYI